MKWILSASNEPRLLKLRGMIMANAGYRVTSAAFLEAFSLAATEMFDLLVVGHSIPLRERELLTERFTLKSRAPIIETENPAGAPTGIADQAFDPYEPEKLLQAIAELLGPGNPSAR